ncbi:MAG TPA: hypothetical protein VNS19_21320 [Acidimicrobiales bacterium]|nr:hypothetical protein [Acidimicrobiales bacterium]
MTDPTDRPDPADAAWFRRHLDPVLDAEPIADAWPQIAARAQGVPPAATRHAERRWLAVAAVLALLAGLAVVVAATRPDDDTTSLQSEQPTPTGLYIPKGLPEGWRLRTAWVAKVPTGCGVSGRSWQRPTKDLLTPRLELSYVPCPLPDHDALGDPGPSLGNGIDESRMAQLEESPATRVLQWDHHGTWTLRSEQGLSEADLVGAARAIVAAPSSTAPPIDGMQLTGTNVAPGIPTGPTLALSLIAPDGNRVSYHLNAPGEGPVATAFTVDEPRDVPGQALPVALRGPEWDGVDDVLQSSRTFRRGTAFVGDWPGADLEAPRVEPIIDDHDRTQPQVVEQQRGAYDELLVQLIGSLRPATAEEWHAFVATAEKVPAARITGAADLTAILGRGKAAPETTPTSTTTTTPPASEPSGPDEAGATRSSPATVTPPTDGQPRERYSDLTGLEVQLQLAGPTVQAIVPTSAVLRIRNTTDHTIAIGGCSLRSLRWGLLPRGESGMLEQDQTDDCQQDAGTRLQAGATSVVPLAGPTSSGFTARGLGDDPHGPFRGTLPGGDYTAIAVLPGATGDIRVEIPVQVLPPPCPMTDAESDAYRGLPTGEASAAIRRDGRTPTVVSEDGVGKGTGWDLDCSRVRLQVVDDEVVDYAFG